jgi:hypothetical protein
MFGNGGGLHEGEALRAGDGIVMLEGFPDDSSLAFTEDGEWVVPDDVHRVLVSVVGAGGGRSKDGKWGGDGGDAAIRRPLDVQPGQRFKVIVGKGGSAGQDGGSSSFSALTPPAS